MAKKYLFSQNKSNKKFNEIYFESIEKTINSNDYKNKSLQIDLYKKVFKNKYKIPEEKIEEFIVLIQEQLELEYENAIESIINYINNNN